MKLEKLIKSYNESIKILNNSRIGINGDIELLRKQPNADRVKIKELLDQKNSYMDQIQWLCETIQDCERFLKIARR